MDDIGRAMFWLLVILALIIAAFAVAMAARKYARSEDAPTASGGPFTLGDLRAMHRRGQINDEEFDRLQAQMIAGLKPQPKDNKPPTPPGETPPDETPPPPPPPQAP